MNSPRSIVVPGLSNDPKYVEDHLAPVADRDRLFLIAPLVLMLEEQGYEIRARMEGYKPPLVLTGTIRDFRPDVVACHDRFKTIMLDAVNIFDYNLQRLELLQSAAKLYNCELHLVIKMERFRSATATLGNKLCFDEITVKKIWEISL
jgi:hypothetical protein